MHREILSFKTEKAVPKTGVMLIGWGGNNGSTLTAGIMANKLDIRWRTKEGEMRPNYFGSVTQSSTVKIGTDVAGRNVFAPLKNLLPMVNPNDLVIGGWDISSLNLAESMRRAQVLDFDLQRNLYSLLSAMHPLPSIYYPDFIAANQSDRADNVLPGNKQDHLEEIRKNIRDFKANNELDKVIVLWTANTERFSSIETGINDTADNLLQSIKVIVNSFCIMQDTINHVLLYS